MSEFEKPTRAASGLRPAVAGGVAENVHRQPASLIEAMARLLATIESAPPWERLPRIRAGERAEIPLNVRRGVWLRDGGRCSWCGDGTRGQMQLDHIVPWSAGGSDRSDNLRVLCANCNDRRSNYRTDADIARVIPVSKACSRCAGWLLDEAYDVAIPNWEDNWGSPDERPRFVEFTDPIAAFCAQCRSAGTAERAWAL